MSAPSGGDAPAGAPGDVPSERPGEALRELLRVMVVTDAGLAAPRSAEDVVRAALEAGVRAIQLRDKDATSAELLEQARRLRAATRTARALLIVNDRLDVALASEADGVHLGPDDLPVAAARSVAPPGFLIGRSADEVEVAARAVADGADYIGCGTVYATSTKPDAGEVIGPAGLRRVVEGVRVPVLGIGGITVARAHEVRATGAAGVAVVGAVMAARDPHAVCRALLGPPQPRAARR